MSESMYTATNYGLMVTLHDMTTRCCGSWMLFLNTEDGTYHCHCGNDFTALAKLMTGQPEPLTEVEKLRLSHALSGSDGKDGEL